MARSRREQLCERFTFLTFQHGKRVAPFVGHGDTFPQRRNDSDRDSAQFDYFIDVGQLWETVGGNVRAGVFVYAVSWLGSCRLAATFQGSNSSMRLMG